MAPRGVVGIGNRVRALAVLRSPLGGTGRTLGLLPLEVEQEGQILVRPRSGLGCPGALETACRCIDSLAGAALVRPSESHRSDICSRGLYTNAVGGLVSAMCLAEGVPSGDESDRLLVVHRHAPEGRSDVVGSGDGVAVSVGPLGVYVDQAHVCCAERLVELAIAVEAVGAEHLSLWAPVHEVWLPVVDPATREAQGLEAHRLHADVPGEDHQVGPGERLAVLGLDGPEQATSLVQVSVVRPAVEGLKANLPPVRAAAPVGDPVGTCAVPRETHHEGTVVSIVRRPPVLAGLQHRLDLRLDGLQVEGCEGGRVVEVAVGTRGCVVSKGAEVDLVWPPIRVWLRLPRREVGGDRVRLRAGVRRALLLLLLLRWGRRWLTRGKESDGCERAGAGESEEMRAHGTSGRHHCAVGPRTQS